MKSGATFIFSFALLRVADAFGYLPIGADTYDSDNHGDYCYLCSDRSGNCEEYCYDMDDCPDQWCEEGGCDWGCDGGEDTEATAAPSALPSYAPTRTPTGRV